MGPGSYDLPVMLGKSPSSTNKFGPFYSMGSRVKTAMNPGTKSMHSSWRATPSPTHYNAPTDNHYFKNPLIAKPKGKKFFEQSNMPRIFAQCPVQYTSIDGMSPPRLNAS